MDEQEVLSVIGNRRWSTILEFMRGQTVGLNKDGSTNDYDQDVWNFAQKPNDCFFD
ncbi:MAG: hypothetical protein AABW68_04415 [archaeon]